MMKFSVVIPVWNEDPRNLVMLYARIAAALGGVPESWELILVDDGNQEPTRAALRDLASRDVRVHLICLEHRRGQETALVTGLLAAQGEWICTLDSDLENRPEDIPRLLAPLRNGYALVLGARRPAARASRLRQALSRVYSSMMNARWGTHIHDWGCGFNAGTRTIIEMVRNGMECSHGEPLKRSFIRCAGRRWTEVEVTLEPRRYGRSGYRGLHFCWHALRMLVTGRTFIARAGNRAPDRAARLMATTPAVSCTGEPS